eukprot:6900537-Pyramimonas_sp.AAC.1
MDAAATLLDYAWAACRRCQGSPKAAALAGGAPCGTQHSRGWGGGIRPSRAPPRGGPSLQQKHCEAVGGSLELGVVVPTPLPSTG